MRRKELTPGELLLKVRRKHKWKQNEFAKKVGCSKSMVCMIEKNQRTPSHALSIKIAKQFPISETQRELLSWYLTKQHRRLERLKNEYPNTFEDLRSSWLRQDKKST